MTDYYTAAVWDDEAERPEDDAAALTDYDLHQMFEEFIDDVYGDVRIFGLDYPTSYVLERVDGPAYREGFNNWLDGEVRDGLIHEWED